MTFYVGETASLEQRLAQHRRKYTDYDTFRALVIPVNALPPLSGTPAGRSLSRQVETMLITQLKLKHNVDICNISADENHVFF